MARQTISDQSTGIGCLKWNLILNNYERLQKVTSYPPTKFHIFQKKSWVSEWKVICKMQTSCFHLGIQQYCWTKQINITLMKLLAKVIESKIKQLCTCIHISSWCRSGDDSGEGVAGGMGWISLGTTTKSRPRTRIAPALLAVPGRIMKQNDLHN